MSKPYILLSKRESDDFYDVKFTANPVLIQKFLEAHKKPQENCLGEKSKFEGLVFALDALPQVISMEIEAKEIRGHSNENGEA